MDALSFIQKLASDGGAIVCSNECVEMEIVNAVTTDRFYVDEQGYGYVLRSPDWLATREKAFNDLSGCIYTVNARGDRVKAYTLNDHTLNDQSMQWEKAEQLGA